MVIAIALVTIALVTIPLTVVPRAQTMQDESPIRAIVAAQAAAWDKGDAAGFAKDISPDVSFTNLFGMVMFGGPSFLDRQRQILSTFFKGTTKRHAIRRIRFVTPDVALVDIDNEVHGVKAMPAGVSVPPDGIIRSQLLEVFVRHDGRWLIEAFHNVDTKPQP